MKLVATRVYFRRVAKLLSQEERRKAENEIADDPRRWPVIPGTGGMRKARVARGASGKRGGARIVYYYWVSNEVVYLLTVYAKSKQADLTPEDKRALRGFLESLENENG